MNLRSGEDDIIDLLEAATLAVTGANAAVSFDNGSLSSLLYLSQDKTGGAVGVLPFVQRMVKSGALVSTACVSLTKALEGAASTNMKRSDSKTLRDACKSGRKLQTAAETYAANEDFVRKNIPDMAQNFDTTNDQSLQTCMEKLEEAEICEN
jgi:hypothetical protein